ncbi:hypothetical protein O6H91_16G064600 [Diphasiastrum complanatum]|nr:hypothetical protein O6H91_16G064600 [Diphasiastrum complanatum]
MDFVSDDKIAEDLEDLYFDMDLSTLDSKAYRKRLSNTSNSPEFEFNMSSTSGAYDTADELFFHGQLLPLHVSPRVMMVQRLSSSRQRASQQRQIQEAKQNGCTFWEYWEKDFQENSYRHSNGSSQDSCFNSKDMHSESKGRCMAFSKTSGSGRVEKSSSWFRAAFSWKILFGFKKTSKIYKGKNSSRSGSSEDKQESRDFVDAHQTTPVSSFSKANHGVLRHANDIDQGTQKTKDYCQRYLKASTTFPVKPERRCKLNEQFWIEEASARNNPGKLSLSGSTFAKQPSCSSFLSRNLRASSFPRRSSAPCSRVNSSQCSPTHSGVLSSFNYGTISDVQNAIQGAIAHCKQSQISRQAPF